METIAPIVARGLLIDLVRRRGEPVERGTVIGLDEVQAAAAEQGIAPSAGDVLLVRTGNARRWDDAETYLAGPGMASEVSTWVAGLGVRAVGADNVAWDRQGSRDERLGFSLPGHVILLVRSGIHILENLDLEELGEAGATEFCFVCLPLKLVGATGSPIRPIALLPG